MVSLKEELEAILADKDQRSSALAFEEFLGKHADQLPYPGEDTNFDKAMWAASQFVSLTQADEEIVKRVTSRLIGDELDMVKQVAVKLRDFVGSTKEAAVAAWQEMLLSMQWQQMVPAGALRGVGTQMVSLGTFQRQLVDANIQVNLGWLVDQDQLRLLLQATGKDEQGLPEVELRIKEAQKGVVFTRKTNRDGAVVAPSIKIEPGQYQIEISWLDQTIETPYFIV